MKMGREGGREGGGLERRRDVRRRDVCIVYRRGK